MSSEDIDINFELAESINETVQFLLDQLLQVHQSKLLDVKENYENKEDKDIVNIPGGQISHGNDIVKETITRLYESIGGVVRFEDYPSTFPQEIQDQLLSNVQLFYDSMNTYTISIIDQYKQVLNRVSTIANSTRITSTDYQEFTETINGIQVSTVEFLKDIETMSSKFTTNITGASFNLDISDDMERYTSTMNIFNKYLKNLEGSIEDGAVSEFNMSSMENQAIDNMTISHGSNVDINAFSVGASTMTFDYKRSKMILYLQNLFKSMTDVIRSKITKAFSTNMNKLISQRISNQIVNIIESSRSVSAATDIVDEYNKQLEDVTSNIIGISDVISILKNDELTDYTEDNEVSLENITNDIESITNQLTDIFTTENRSFLNEFNKSAIPDKNISQIPKQPSTTSAQHLSVEDVIRKHMNGKTWSIDIDLGVIPSDPGYIRNFTTYIVNRYIGNFVQNSVRSMMQ